MPDAIDVTVGGWFKVVLRKNGGTNYGWCLSEIPKGIVLAGCDSECATQMAGGPVDQTFYFLVSERPEEPAQLAFQLICLSEPDKQAAEKTIINLKLIEEKDNNPLGAGKFVQYAENAAFVNAPIEKYGFPWLEQGYAGVEKYGFPCASVQTLYGYPPMLKYGYPGCWDQNASTAGYEGSAAFKYGYPGCVDPPVLKYGYPGCVDPPVLKYGYPGCVETPMVKYGYPGCWDQNASAAGYEGSAVFKYGYPGCVDSPVLKYGYPGCVDPSIMKYGYPGCVEQPMVKYGYPGCWDQNAYAAGYANAASLMYGYPGCVAPPMLKYGYYGCQS